LGSQGGGHGKIDGGKRGEMRTSRQKSNKKSNTEKTRRDGSRINAALLDKPIKVRGDTGVGV